MARLGVVMLLRQAELQDRPPPDPKRRQAVEQSPREATQVTPEHVGEHDLQQKDAVRHITVRGVSKRRRGKDSHGGSDRRDQEGEKAADWIQFESIHRAKFNCDNEKSKRKSPESTQQQHLLTFNREKESVVIIVIGFFCA